jgi:hypothetical protein
MKSKENLSVLEQIFSEQNKRDNNSDPQDIEAGFKIEKKKKKKKDKKDDRELNEEENRLLQKFEEGDKEIDEMLKSVIQQIDKLHLYAEGITGELDI